MNDEMLRELIKKYLASLDNKTKDEWWGTKRAVAKEFMKPLIEMLKTERSGAILYLAECPVCHTRLSIASISLHEGTQVVIRPFPHTCNKEVTHA